jgi:hypothetical protein
VNIASQSLDQFPVAFAVWRVTDQVIVYANAHALHAFGASSDHSTPTSFSLSPFAHRHTAAQIFTCPTKHSQRSNVKTMASCFQVGIAPATLLTQTGPRTIALHWCSQTTT